MDDNNLLNNEPVETDSFEGNDFDSEGLFTEQEILDTIGMKKNNPKDSNISKGRFNNNFLYSSLKFNF